jgi:hypothetical protein
MNDLTPNGNPSVKPDHLYLEADRLETEDLNKLFSGKILALCVKDFYPLNLLPEFNNLVLNHPNKDGYGVDQQIVRTGVASFYDTVGDPNFREEYLNSSMNWMRGELERFSYRTPIYAVMLEVMANWLYGIQFEQLGGKSMWVGSARLFDLVGCLAHRDCLGVDAPEFKRAAEVKRQLAVNVYSLMPSQGAEIDIFNLRLTEEEYNARCIPGSYGIDPEQLPPPDITISPKVGDLILFDSNCIHMARPSNGLSIAHSCFMGFRGFDLPLTVWS